MSGEGGRGTEGRGMGRRVLGMLRGLSQHNSIMLILPTAAEQCLISHS